MHERLAGLLNQPLCIGHRQIQKRLVLSPMTQLGNVAFREMIDGFSLLDLFVNQIVPAGIRYQDK